MAAVDTRRDWSQLNPELLELIAGLFTEISDHFRFRSVCRSWRSSNELHPPPCRGPWLLLLPLLNPQAQIEDDCHVISPFDSWRSFTLRTPYSLKMKSCHVYGSPYGYFLVVDRVAKSISITNPLIPGSWFTLPSPLLLPSEDEQEVSSEEGVDVEAELDVNMAKIVMFDESKFNVVVSLFEDGNPFLWRTGDSTWKQMYENDWDVLDFVLYKGNFYIVESREKTVVLSAISLIKISEIEHPQIEMANHPYFGYFLVESSSGELLMVVWEFSYTIWIFQLDFSKQQPKWVKVRNIGDDTLFLHKEGVMCFPTGLVGGFAKNCLYFVPFYGVDKVIIFDMEDDEFEYLPYDTRGQRPAWIIPGRSIMNP